MRYCIPAKVLSFNANLQLAECVPAVRKLITNGTEQEYIDLPPIVKVPVIYPHAQTQGFALTLPISKGDQVLLCVADRSIDKWVEFGNIQNPHEPIELRHNDITDSLAIIGATPNPQALTDYQTNAIELRNKDRSTRVTLTNDTITAQNDSGAFVKLKSDGEIEIHSPVEIKMRAPLFTWHANQIATARYSGTGDIVATFTQWIINVKNMITPEVSDYNEHTHPGDSGGTTGPPDP